MLLNVVSILPLALNLINRKFPCAGAIDFSIGCLARLETDNLSANSFVEKSFSVYPNPFSESITIESKDINLTNTTVRLYDINGRNLSKYQLQNILSYTIPMNGDLAKGNYVLKITSEEKTETIKIIKQ